LIPKPDPRDDVNYQRLVGLEQSMLARISPRQRNRWPELLAIDKRWEECDWRQEALRKRVASSKRRRRTTAGRK